MKVAVRLFYQLTDHYWELRRDGGTLLLEPTPFSGKLPDDLVRSLKDHKPELLALVHYHEEADALLLESSRRLAAAWPKGCPLEGAAWEEQERNLHLAYLSGNLAHLTTTLTARESLALKMFEAFRKEMAA